MKLSESYRSALRFFTYYYANGTLSFVSGEMRLDDYDYQEILKDMPSNFEMVFAVFSNNIAMDNEGTVINFEHATKRASQFILSVCNHDYVVESEFEGWEMALY